MAAVLTKHKPVKEIPTDPPPPGDGVQTEDAPALVEPESLEELQKEEKESANTIDGTKLRLSKYKEARVSPRVWFALQNKIHKDYWENIIIYVFRVLPKILRKRVNPDNPSNIGTYVQPVTENGVLNAHGWGKYRLSLNDSSRTDRTCIAWTVFTPEVAFDEYPPKLDYRELDVEHPENRAYVDFLKLRGILDSAGMVTENNKVAAQTGVGSDPALLQFMERMFTRLGDVGNSKRSDTESQAIQKAIEIVGKGGDRVAEMVTKNSDPMTTVKLIEAILGTKGNNGSDGASKQLEMMHQDLMETRKQNAELMMKLIDRPDPLEGLLKMKDLLDGLKGEGEAPSRNWKEKLVDSLPAMAPAVLNLMAAALQGRATGQRVPVNGMTGQPIAESPMGPVQEPPRAIEGAPVPEAPPPTQQEQIAAQIRQYGMFIVQAVARGESGDAFAQSLETMFGLESGIYPTIASLGKEGIIASLRSAPEVWNRLAPMNERLEKFVDEFLEFGKPGEEGEEA